MASPPAGRPARRGPGAAAGVPGHRPSGPDAAGRAVGSGSSSTGAAASTRRCGRRPSSRGRRRAGGRRRPGGRPRRPRPRFPARAAPVRHHPSTVTAAAASHRRRGQRLIQADDQTPFPRPQKALLCTAVSARCLPTASGTFPSGPAKKPGRGKHQDRPGKSLHARRPSCGCPGSAGTWVSRAIGRISTTRAWAYRSLPSHAVHHDLYALAPSASAAVRASYDFFLPPSRAAAAREAAYPEGCFGSSREVTRGEGWMRRFFHSSRR